MSNNMINLIGWILFIFSATGFCIAIVGSFGLIFGSIFFLIPYLVSLIPFFRWQTVALPQASSCGCPLTRMAFARQLLLYPKWESKLLIFNRCETTL